MLSDINNILILITVIIDVTLAVYLALKDRKSAVNLSFSAVILSLAFWGISYVFWSIAKDPLWSVFWIDMRYVGPSLAAAFFLYFAIVFPKRDSNISPLRTGLIFIPCLLISLTCFTSLVASGNSPPYIEPPHGPLYPLFVFYFILYLVLAFAILLLKYFKSTGRERLQLQYLIIGTLLSSIIGVYTNIYLATSGLSIGPIMVAAVGPVSTLAIVVFVTYAIARHKLLDIDDFLTRGVLYITVPLLIAGSTYIISTRAITFLIPFLVILANIAIGLFILLQNRKAEINRLFCVLTFCLAFWMYSAFKFLNSVFLNDIFVWGKLSYLALIPIPPILLYFTFIFPKRNKKFTNLQKLSLFISPLIFVLILPSTLLIKGISLTGEGFALIFGPGYPFFIIYFLSYAFYGLIGLFNKYSQALGIERMQMRYLFLGLTIGSLSGFQFNVFAPYIGTIKYIGYGPIVSLLLVGLTAYAIGVKRILSVEYIVEKGLIYLLISAFLMIFYLFFVLISGQQLYYVLRQRTMLLVVLLTLFAPLVYQPIYNTLQKLLDRIMYGERSDYQKMMIRMSHEIASVKKLDELIDLIVINFLDAIKVKEISFLIYDGEKNRFRSAPCIAKTEGRYKRIEIDGSGAIPTWLDKNKDVLVVDEIENEIDKHYFTKSEEPLLQMLQQLRDELKKLGMAVWVPVISKNKLSAIICLGYKLSADMYSDEDIGLLKTLSNQIAVSLENSMMYSTIARQYEELNQTKDKLVQVEKLVSLGTMAAGMAHEIKNPLSSLKIFSQLIHDRYEDPEFRKKFEDIIPKEIDRIDRIVERLLYFARSPKLMLEEVNLSSLFEDILHDFEEQIARENISVVKTLPPDLKLMADKDQLSRALSNIILNAIQSMTKGGKLIIEANTLGMPVEKIIIKIMDTGCGIPSASLKQIFDPFFTTKHYGTGLGLPIVHSIIDSHKGTIEIESQVDVGTVVTVTLPAEQPVV